MPRKTSHLKDPCRRVPETCRSSQEAHLVCVHEHIVAIGLMMFLASQASLRPLQVKINTTIAVPHKGHGGAAADKIQGQHVRTQGNAQGGCRIHWLLARAALPRGLAAESWVLAATPWTRTAIAALYAMMTGHSLCATPLPSTAARVLPIPLIRTGHSASA